MTVVDARGLSCPEPVVLTKQALAKNEAQYEILVDAEAAKENVTRFAMHEGYKVDVKENNGEYTLSLTK